MRRLPALAGLSLALAAVSACGEGDFLTGEEVLEQAAEIEVAVPPGHGPLALPEIRSDALFEEGTPEALVHDLAMCAWMGYWLERHEAGDDGGMAAAIEGIAGVQGMDIYDRHDHSWRDVIEGAVGAAELGDPSEMRLFVQNNC